MQEWFYSLLFLLGGVILSKINLQILKQFNGNGLDFAYPTLMIYKKDLN